MQSPRRSPETRGQGEARGTDAAPRHVAAISQPALQQAAMTTTLSSPYIPHATISHEPSVIPLYALCLLGDSSLGRPAAAPADPAE